MTSLLAGLPDLSEAGVELVLRAFAHAAGVDHDNVRGFGLARLFVASLLEQPSNAL